MPSTKRAKIVDGMQKNGDPSTKKAEIVDEKPIFQVPSTKMGKIVDGKQQLRRKAAAKTEKGPLPIAEKLKKVSKKFAGLEKMPTFAIPFGNYAEFWCKSRAM